MSASLTRRQVFDQSWPIMLGQASVPLVGIVDTVVIGRSGDAVSLAGVALGATIVSFVFWAFGFLRMGMTGMTAQADGASDGREVDRLLARGMLLGLGLGTALFIAQILLIPAALGLMAGSANVSAEAQAYVAARFWGAPAALALFALLGWLLGLGRTRAALFVQIAMNAINGMLDVVLVWGFGFGAQGIGLGTAIAEWSALVIGLVIAFRIAGPGMRAALADRAALFDRTALKRLFAVNADIMVRTVALLFLFAWFTNAGAREGATTLAAQHVLMQFVAVSAFVLDGFAFTAEMRIGQAVGRRSRKEFDRALRLTAEFSLLAGLAFAVGIWLAGNAVIAFVTPDDGVRAVAGAMLWAAALVPFIGVPAWLLDGVFLGATAGRSLRTAALISTAAYIATDIALRPYGVTGIWSALLASYLYRAGALAAFLPHLRRSIAPEPARA